MGFKEYHEFVTYIKQRRIAFLHKHNLSNKPNYLKDYHYPNNIRYLDNQSQMIIKHLNNTRLSIRDRVLSVYIYRLLGDMYLVAYFAIKGYLLDLRGIQNLAEFIEENPHYILNKYPIQVTKEEELLEAVEYFIENVPIRMLYNKNTTEVAKFLRAMGIKGLEGYLLYEFAYDLTYIEELNITPSFSPCVPNKAQKMFLYIKGMKGFDTEAYWEFTYKIIKLYRSWRSPYEAEKYVSTVDVTHMLIGFYNYTHKVNYPRNLISLNSIDIKDIEIPRRYYEKFSSEHLRSKTYR